MRAKVSKIWREIGQVRKVNRLACWDILLADKELATLVGKGNEAKGKAMLEAMKSAKALDVSGDGSISQEEFNRLYDQAVLAAAEAEGAKQARQKSALVAKMSRLWGQVGATGKVVRAACWKVLLEDEELAALVGSGDKPQGFAMLEAIKAAKALDISGDNVITKDEFQRLSDPGVLAAAEAQVRLRRKVDALWAEKGGATGGIERLACWDILLADDELAMLVGKGELRRGKAVLEAMKAAKALDVSGDGSITQEEFKRLYDPAVLAAAEAGVPLRKKVGSLWLKLGGPTGSVDRESCWKGLLADEELAMLVGKPNKIKGRAMLRAMKSARALDVSGDGRITEQEFRRLYDPAVLAAAEADVMLVPKVESLWRELAGSDLDVERLSCWKALLSDDDLASYMGRGDAARGRGVLEAMKTMKALDTSGDGYIDEDEFKRLFRQSVITAAETVLVKTAEKHQKTL